MLRGKLIPKISLFFPPDLLFILNRSNSSPLYKLVLRLCKSTVNGFVYHPALEPQSATWAPVPMQGHFLNPAWFNSQANKTPDTLLLPCWFPSCTVLPVCVFFHFPSFSPCLCWGCHHVCRRPSIPRQLVSLMVDGFVVFSLCWQKLFACLLSNIKYMLEARVSLI